MTKPDYPMKKRLVEHEGKLYYERFSKAQRFQHLMLLSSFTLLILTGVPLLLPDSWILRQMFWFEGSFTLRGILHRLAAIVLLFISIYHAFFCLFSPRGNRDLREMVPLWKDVTDFFGMIRYNLGKSDSHPRFGRFNYIEKFEYYAVAWGSLIMLVTGVCLWFPVEATILFPRWVLDIIRVVHGFEAILAFMAIIIWHMYNVHLHPEVFPMSRIWINGRMDLDFLRRHHVLEYERLLESVPAEVAERIYRQLGRQSAVNSSATSER